MSFVQPAPHSKSAVDRAGLEVARDWLHPAPTAYREARTVASNWRSSHRCPLQSIKMTLKQRAVAVDPLAVVAQRLKRMESIIDKLRREPRMKLSQMQDLGGCRAIVGSVSDLEALCRLYGPSDRFNS